MARDTKRILEGKQPSADSANAVNDTPEAFKGWVENNRDRINASLSLPYFVRDNAKYTGITAKQTRTPQTPIDIAAARHAKRTIAQAQDIKRRYWERFEPDYLTDEQKLANIEAYLQIEKDLGIKRGRPMSHEQANKMHGNPHYGESKAYSVNCQTCVVAYELRLRGFDVSALPNTAGSALSRLSKTPHTAWQNITREDIPVIARTTLDRYGRIKQPTLKWAKVSAAMADPGRYHISWRWKRKRSGHIITAERLPDGNLRFYDPQNGMSGALDLYKKDIAGNIRIYRVDALAPNASIVKDVLTKGEAKAATGTAAQGGISGKIDYSKVWPLRKEALNSDRFKTEYAERNAPNLFTGRIKLSKKSLRRSLKHCENEEEISALQYVWANHKNLIQKRISPLGENKDLTNLKDIKNIEKKKKRGVVDYIEYEISINGRIWIVKTERTKWNFEQLYQISKK